MRRMALGVVGWLQAPQGLSAIVELCRDPEVRRTTVGTLVYAPTEAAAEAVIARLMAGAQGSRRGRRQAGHGRAGDAAD
jgi:hypothetical protein